MSAADSKRRRLRVVDPPTVPGLPPMRLVDVLRLVWWTQVGFRYGAFRGGRRSQLVSSVVAILWWPLLPLLVIYQLVLVGRPWARYYLSPGKNAVLGLVATRDGWLVTDHACAHPGTGQGAALRAQLLPVLVAAADAEQVPVLTTAATAGLAATYTASVPGLDEVSRRWPRGHNLRRNPSPMP